MLSLILPTYNESEHLPTLVRQIFEVVGRHKLKTEVIIIDDNSPDGTGELAYYMRKFYPNLRSFHRSHKMGKTSAILEGFAQAQGSLIGTLHANLSHPPLILPTLAMPLLAGHAQLAIASRFLPESDSSQDGLTHLGGKLLNLLYRPLTTIHDPRSGYFLLHKSLIHRRQFDGAQADLLPELLFHTDYKVAHEVPYTYAGASAKSLAPLAKLRQLGVLYRLRYF